MHFKITCRSVGEVTSLIVYRKLFHITKSGDWYNFERRRTVKETCISITRITLKDWKEKFLYVDDRCIPLTMTWRPTDSPSLKYPASEDHLINYSLVNKITEIAHLVHKYLEHILVVGG